MSKPRTPQDLAKLKASKSKYTVYLSDEPMRKIKAMSNDDVSVSAIVDEAIKTYLEQVSDKKK